MQGDDLAQHLASLSWRPSGMKQMSSPTCFLDQLALLQAVQMKPPPHASRLEQNESSQLEDLAVHHRAVPENLQSLSQVPMPQKCRTRTKNVQRNGVCYVVVLLMVQKSR